MLGENHENLYRRAELKELIGMHAGVTAARFFRFRSLARLAARANSALRVTLSTVPLPLEQ